MFHLLHFLKYPLSPNPPDLKVVQGWTSGTGREREETVARLTQCLLLPEYLYGKSSSQ